MIVRTIAQIFLAASLLPFFPHDIGVVESYATFSEAEERSPMSIEQAISLVYRPLPTAADLDRAPIKKDPYSLGVRTSSVSAMVVDVRGGSVLFEKNSDESRSIGSITKLMTALVYLEGQSDLEAPAQVEPVDVRAGGRDHLTVGDTVRAHDLLLASLVGSDNSATMSLARLSGLSESDFVARMNERAAEIGMRSTTFVDPTGLAAGNRSVAGDIVVLLQAALDRAEIREATALAMVTITGASGQNYEIESTNELLGGFLNQSPYQVVGGKTGYIPEAGYCLGVQVRQEGGGDLYVVVLGSDSDADRFQDVKALSAWAYKVYEWPTQGI